MFEREAHLYQLMFIFLQKLLADVDDSTLCVPICDGGNAAAFTLGHLAVTGDYALRNLGQPRIASAEWHRRFRPGSLPRDDESPLPTKGELLKVLTAQRESILASIANVDPQKMNEPTTSEFFKDTPVKTIGDALAHLLTSHFAFHVGQISAWRRLQGKSFVM